MATARTIPHRETTLMTMPTPHNSRPRKRLPQTLSSPLNLCRCRSVDESVAPATNAAGKRSSVMANSHVPTVRSIAMVRPLCPSLLFFSLFSSCPAFLPNMWLTYCRVFVRPTLQPPSQSRPAVCRSPGSPHAKGRGPPPSSPSGCQSR